MSILVFNALLYLILFLYMYRRKSPVNIFLVSMYLLSAVVSIYTFSSGIYKNQQSYYTNGQIELFPYIYFYVCILVLMYPLYTIRIRPIEKNSNDIIRYLDYYNYFFILISIITIIICIPTFNDSLSLYSSLGEDSSLSDTMLEKGEGASFYSKTQSRFISIYVLFRTLAIISFFYYISFCKKGKWFLLLLALSCVVPQFFRSIINISRGSLFFVLIDILCGYFLFYKTIPSHSKKIINITMLSSAGLFVIFALLISFSRFGQTSHNDAYDSIVSYFGEPFLNFNLIYWDKVKHYMYGTFNFAQLLHIFDSNVYFPETKAEAFWFYRQYTGVPVSPFRMIIGGMYIDFGLYTILFCALLSICFKIFISRIQNTIPSYIVSYLCVYIIAHGVFTFDLTFDKIISTLFFCSLFSLLQTKKGGTVNNAVIK